MISVWMVLLGFHIANFMVTPFLGLYIVGHGGTFVFVGLIFALNFAMGLLFRIPAAQLADRYGKKTFVIIGISLHSVGLFFYALSPEAISIVLGTMLRGIGFAIYHPSILSMMVDKGFSGGSKGNAIGFVTTAPAIAQTVGPGVGAAIFLIGSFSGMFVTAMFLSILAAILTWIFIAPLPRQPGAGQPFRIARFRHMLFGEFNIILFTRLTVSYLMGSVNVFLPLMAAKSLGFAEPQIGLLFVVAAIFNIAARPIGGKYASRLGEVKIMQVGALFAGLATLAYAFAGIPGLIWVGAPLYGFGVGLFFPSALIYVGKTVPQPDRTMSMAFITIMFDIGTVLGSLLSPQVFSLGGFMYVFLCSSAISFSGAALQSVRFKRAMSGKSSD